MITAIDTSILIDVFRDDPTYGRQSASKLRSCMADGKLVACEVVWSELAAMFPVTGELESHMERLQIEFLGMTQGASRLAGLHWKSYLERGGKRTRVIADFLIAAHAQAQCDQLLTRDQGFHRDYFRELTVISPTTGT